MSSDKKPARILSMDQFRGYTVAGMFLVNFVGGFAVAKAFAHGFLVHNNTHFSYADSIMPSFMFCAGFSYRLTALRRFRELGTLPATWSYLRRSLALIGVSLFAFGIGTLAKEWSDFTPAKISEFFFGLVKSGMWETLAIIGVSQIILLPVISRGFWVRLFFTIGLALLHLGLTYAFNYRFQLGQPNWFNQFWGAHTKTTWDGGMFGTLAWSVPMAAGTLVYDVLASVSPVVAFRRFLVLGVLLMASAYALSCGTRLYDRSPAQIDAIVKEREAIKALAPKKGEKETDDAKKLRETREANLRAQEHASDPVWPAPSRWASPGIGWAEPPFVSPLNTDHRQMNFWMMNKKFVTLSFNLFALGFALTLYSFFIVACDLNHVELGLFRTLGQNPLAAYLVHEATSHGIQALVPKDSPVWYVTAAFLVFFWLTWVVIRYMENHKLYLRL